jgi:8-oxo-dGTP diphosphatase
MSKDEYPRPSLTVDAVVLVHNSEHTKLLVITRKNQPFQGNFALPGGYVDRCEPVEVAVARELQEETGIDLTGIDPIKMNLRTNQDMRRDPRGWTVTQPFLYWLPESRPIQAGDDAATAQWVNLDDLEEMAFDHGAILCEALGLFWQPFHTYNPRLPKYNLNPYGAAPGFVSYSPSMNVYPGTFETWHDGHEYCASNGQHEHTIVIPDANPTKARVAGCVWKRYKELKAIIGERFSVFPGFIGNETGNYLYTWFPVMNNGMNMIIGDDSLHSIEQWRHHELILAANATITVIQRLRTDIDNFEHMRKLEKWKAINFHYVSYNPYGDVSSTKLRYPPVVDRSED